MAVAVGAARERRRRTPLGQDLDGNAGFDAIRQEIQVAVAHRNATESPIEFEGVLAPPLALAVDADPPAERRVRRRERPAAMRVDDAAVILPRQTLRRHCSLCIGDRGIVDRDEAVKPTGLAGADDVVEALRSSHVTHLLLGPLGFATERDRGGEDSAVGAVGHQRAVGLANLDAGDAITPARRRECRGGSGGGRDRGSRGRRRLGCGRPEGCGRWLRAAADEQGQGEKQTHPASRARSASIALALAVWAGAALAEEPPRLRPVFGEERRALVVEGQTLLEIAFQERLGFDAVKRLNPEVDPWIPDPGKIVRLPTRFVLPVDATEPERLVINIPEMRLYDFTVDPPEVFAVAIGDAMDPSLVGVFAIGQKRVDPAWNVPESIRKEKPHLPPVVPPGPDNPLGSRWMTIGTTSYGIHGTNTRWSIGREATHGCIRLYEDDIERLFERTAPGTRIDLVYEPYKWGVQNGQILVEVHPDRYHRLPDRLAAALATPRALGLLDHIDLERAWRVVEEAAGVPVAVGALADPKSHDAVISKPTS